MDEADCYEQTLGLNDPRFVSDLRLDMEVRQVDVFAGHSDRTKFCCPRCGVEMACYDHTPEQRWRHLDTIPFKTVLHAKPPGVKRSEHSVRQIQLPWAENNSHIVLRTLRHWRSPGEAIRQGGSKRSEDLSLIHI